MAHSMVLSILLGFCLFASIRGALFDFLDLNRTLGLTEAASVVAGNFLYIDGGVHYPPTSFGLNNPYTLAVDLQKQWNSKTVTANHVRRHGEPREIEYMFGNNRSNSLYTFGGVSSQDFTPPLPGLTVLHLSELKASWSHIDPQTPPKIEPSYWGLSARSPDAFFLLGGLTDMRQIPNVDARSYFNLPGLAIYNITTETWTNVSSEAYANGRGNKGSGQYVPIFGEQGVIFFLGGESPPTPIVRTDNSYYTSMQQIFFYDIASQKFHSQTTTSSSGTFPLPRDILCTAGVANSDGESFDIFMYGGQNPTVPPNARENQVNLNSVWVLSLPSFEWTPLYDTADNLGSSGHTCEVIGNRQMAVIGGFPAVNHIHFNKHDIIDPGPRIFDMAELKWSDGYDPKAAPYVRSSVLANMAKNQPFPSHWDSPVVKQIFDPETSKNKAQSGSAPSGNTSSGNTDSSSTNNVPVIVGATIGGVVVLTLIALAILFAVRSRSKRNQKFEAGPNEAFEKDAYDSSTDITGTRISSSKTLTPNTPVQTAIVHARTRAELPPNNSVLEMGGTEIPHELPTPVVSPMVYYPNEKGNFREDLPELP